MSRLPLADLAPYQFPQMIPDRLLLYLDDFFRSCVQSCLTAVASFQDLNFVWRLSSYLENALPCYFKKAKDILRYRP
jgi:hypothetical protein